MADEPDLIIKLLQKLREDMSRGFLAVHERIDTTNGRLEALTELTVARFTTVENALLDLSARTHMLSGQVQRATSRYDRELDDVKTRLTTLEET